MTYSDKRIPITDAIKELKDLGVPKQELLKLLSAGDVLAEGYIAPRDLRTPRPAGVRFIGHGGDI